MAKREGPGINWTHWQMMQDFYAARDLWLARREQETALYAGDIKIWQQENPRPQLREFLANMRYSQFAANPGDAEDVA